MKQIQAAVAAYLEQETGIRTVCDRTAVRGEYPLLSVSVAEQGTTLLAGGRMAERRYEVNVTAVSDREREGTTALLGELVPVLLRGVPVSGGLAGKRMLHPLRIRTKDGELTFTLEVCAALPGLFHEGEAAPEPMQTLHFGV